MSDWLERELARGLAPMAAPDVLKIRLGFAPAARWEFPRMALALAAAVVMMIGGGYAASRTAALDSREFAARELCGAETAEFASTDPVAIAPWLPKELHNEAPHREALHREAGLETPLRPLDDVHLTGVPLTGVPLAGARLIRRRSVPVAALGSQVIAGRATLLVAHAGSAVAGTHNGTPGFQMPAHALAATPEAGCLPCHSL
jgi:hypothetical protein